MPENGSFLIPNNAILPIMNIVYKRLLLKISGEQLAGNDGTGIDPGVVRRLADEIRDATEASAQIVVMIGGGNYVRGALTAGDSLTRVTADYMGMLGTMINGLALGDMFNAHDLPAHVLTSIQADQVADRFTQRRALHHLAKGRVVIIAGGIGRPYLTTDTAALSLALELECDAVCKVTKVDGVYDKDPVKHPDATRITRMGFTEALENPHVRVMDKAALALALEYKKPLIICDMHTPGNIRRVVTGQDVGTSITTV